jgi:uncharacterized protein (DUF169 family)
MKTKEICRVLEGKVRGRPVAIARFTDTPPQSCQGIKVDPCQILRHAMDDGKAVYFDRQHQDCLHGAYITGVHPGNEQISSGRLLTDYIPVYNQEAAYAFNSGEYILPQGTVNGFCAAPLDAVPDDLTPEWIVLVCTPSVAALAGAARAVKDGTRPDTAAGNSFCSDLFVTPVYSDNVLVTTGDMGGRMNNRLRESEMFVIIPVQWADSLIELIGEIPDVKGIYEATRPDESAYWQRKRSRSENSDARLKKARDEYGLEITMPWDDEALREVRRAPAFIRAMAVANVEEYAAEHDAPMITLAVVKAQAESVGMGKFLSSAKASSGFLGKLLGRIKRG